MLSTVEGWFRTDKGRTLSGSDVTDWVNQIAGQDVTSIAQGTPANRPVLDLTPANLLNGHAGFLFDRDDLLIGAGLLPGSPGSTVPAAIYVVLRQETTDWGNLVSSGVPGLDELVNVFISVGMVKMKLSNGSVGYSAEVPERLGDAVLIRAEAAAINSRYLEIEGVSDTGLTTSAPFILDATHFGVGDFHSSGIGAQFTVWDVIVCKEIPSAAEQLLIDAYVLDRYLLPATPSWLLLSDMTLKLEDPATIYPPTQDTDTGVFTLPAVSNDFEAYGWGYLTAPSAEGVLLCEMTPDTAWTNHEQVGVGLVDLTNDKQVKYIFNSTSNGFEVAKLDGWLWNSNFYSSALGRAWAPATDRLRIRITATQIHYEFSDDSGDSWATHYTETLATAWADPENVSMYWHYRSANPATVGPHIIDSLTWTPS